MVSFCLRQFECSWYPMKNSSLAANSNLGACKPPLDITLNNIQYYYLCLWSLARAEPSLLFPFVIVGRLLGSVSRNVGFLVTMQFSRRRRRATLGSSSPLLVALLSLTSQLGKIFAFSLQQSALDIWSWYLNPSCKGRGTLRGCW